MNELFTLFFWRIGKRGEMITYLKKIEFMRFRSRLVRDDRLPPCGLRKNDMMDDAEGPPEGEGGADS